MPLSAVLLDMDGTLVDSEPLWTVAEEELAERLGGTWTAELKTAVMGTRLDVSVPTILRALGHPAGAAEVAETTAWLLERMRVLYAQAVPVRPGALALLEALHAAGIPAALVSSSFRVLVDGVLDTLGRQWFATSVAGDEVRHGKPHPEAFLVACERLGVRPADCVVVEDSEAGMAAGVAAGCTVVGVPSHGELAAGPRRHLLPSLTGLDLGLARRLVDEPAA